MMERIAHALLAAPGMENVKHVLSFTMPVMSQLIVSI